MQLYFYSAEQIEFSLCAILNILTHLARFHKICNVEIETGTKYI